ncbi:iron-siderophore ABC transporter substrate-binding protein [Nonomuraea sp. NPDC050404]|uniref:iron-siderophore ABC transporter substrate-binding protein n=1 Tax=Nonomuraea sp. NPDC050404 TaxID=3155783 RepID=UPI003408E2AD
MRPSLSRGAFRLLIVSLAATLAAACSATTPPADEPAGETAAADAAFPVTIPTEFGDITVEKRPAKVVALGWSDAETAFALGVQPVGAADWLAFGGDGLGPWVQGEYRKPPAILGTLEVKLESLAALEPDLILDTRASGKKERYDQLAELGVPVIGPPKGGQAYRTSWDEQLDMIGKALGKSQEAAKLKADLEAKFAKAAQDNPSFKGTEVAVGARTGDSYGAYVSGGRLDFLEKLGFVVSPKIMALAGKDFSVPVSKERMDLFDSDLTIMFPIAGNGKQIADDPLFKAVPSVKAGRSLVLNDRDVATAFSSTSVTGLSYALDKVVPLLADAMKK